MVESAAPRRVGPARTLDLSASVDDPAAATEAWLRDRQIAAAGTVMIVCRALRGSASAAVRQRVARLQRQGVVRTHRTVGDTTLFVDLAPVAAMLSSTPRSRHRTRIPAASSIRAIRALDPETSQALEALAVATIHELGVECRDDVLLMEMRRHHAILNSGIPASEPERARRLRFVIEAALRDLRA